MGLISDPPALGTMPVTKAVRTVATVTDNSSAICNPPVNAQPIRVPAIAKLAAITWLHDYLAACIGIRRVIRYELSNSVPLAVVIAASILMIR
jgi:hypothetical protein